MLLLNVIKKIIKAYHKNGYKIPNQKDGNRENSNYENTIPSFVNINKLVVPENNIVNSSKSNVDVDFHFNDIFNCNNDIHTNDSFSQETNSGSNADIKPNKK